ncbi:MAG TPA: hypothetical protein VKQ27_09675 [Acetobacteraceae bacterium]|nr:hypothetical protein [Acetobacteraceae bacterium]
MAGGLLQVAGAAIPGTTWLTAGLSSLSHLLLLAGMLGLWTSGAMGRGRIARAGTWITVISWAILAVAEFVDVVSTDVAVPLFSAATVGLPAGLILAGIATLRTRLWKGWHRFIPLIAGLFVVLVVFPSFALPGHDFEYVIAAWGVCFVLLGAAMWAEA